MKLINNNKLPVILLICVLSFKGMSQEHKYSVATVAFYNVENLFDTINSVDMIRFAESYASPKHRTAIEKGQEGSLPSTTSYTLWDITDEEFTPSGNFFWNTERYRSKISHIAKVIAQIGSKETQQPPAIVGLSEIENESVLQDLVTDPQLNSAQYGIVHFNSPDERGIDVALLYQKKRFVVVKATPLELVLEVPENGKRDYTRDILLVKGLLDGQLIYFLVNHWPSRSGGEKKSAPLRMQAAQLCKKTVDSILREDPSANIVIMGDLNDDPTDKSLLKGLGATDQKKEGHLFNTMLRIFRDGQGSLAYQDNWNLFDQLIISHSLCVPSEEKYYFWKSGIFNPSFLLQSSGSFKNYPFRTFSGGAYTNGYSDHLPVYLHLIRKTSRR